MRFTGFLILFAFSTFGQKHTRPFRLPENHPQHTPGVVIAKLKPQFGVVDFALLKKTKVSQSQIKHLLPLQQQTKERLRMGPRTPKSNVDISLYLEITFKGTDIESFINELYGTGYFEIIEPDYAAKLNYTPSDPLKTNQYYLQKIRAFDAWDITKGSPNIVIGIVDTGGDLNHPDLISQLYTNFAEPIDGVDNDNDGYVDNNRGWDFMGADTVNINLPNFVGDNNASNPNGGLGGHGTAVAGCAAATTDNSVGISGVGFNSKLLFTKQSADNQGENNGTIYKGYSGILYAATHGAKIINCSWGSFVYSQIQQDLINYVSLDLGCLVVAAAGNANTGAPSYPASYQQVLSVAASTANDVRTNFSNYGQTVDLIAPGRDIFTTAFDNAYEEIDGTSFSAPLVAGAAALVWAQNPTWTAAQVAEQVRVTADESIYLVNSPSFAKQLGKGRLDVYSALTKQMPSVRAVNPKLLNASGSVALPGEEAFLYLDFTNYLQATSPGIAITLSAVQATFAVISKSTVQPGIIGTNQTINNKLNPFKLTINPSIAQNATLDFILTYVDGEYADFQYISFPVNPSFLDIDDNQIVTTIASNGRLGFENTASQTNGVGFVVNDDNLLYEMGLMMGTSSSTLFDNVRNANGFNQEFVVTEKIREIIPGERSAAEIFGAFTDNQASKTVAVQYRSLVWREAPFDRFIVLEYKVKNISGAALNNFHMGLFADWDITDNGGGDLARWDEVNTMGYVHTAQPDVRPHAGIKLLKGVAPGYYAIDNNHQTSGVPFGIYDGFTDTEKIAALTSGIARTEAGVDIVTGGDVSHVVSAGPYNIAANEEITVAFALVAAPDLTELQRAAQYADTAYNYILELPRPTVDETKICYGTTATITATGANQFKWYKDFFGGDPFFIGNTINTDVLFGDTILYVSNADQSYESVRSEVLVKVLADPSLITSGLGTICEGSTINLSVAEADVYTWSTGATTQSIEISEAGDYSVFVQTASPNCSGTSEVFSLNVDPSPTSDFSISGDLVSGETIQFSNNSIGATSFRWDFGDNTTSHDFEPEHVYTSVNDFTVTLVSTNAFGCSDMHTETIQIITGVEKSIEILAYPIPTDKTLTLSLPWLEFNWIIFDKVGKLSLAGDTQSINVEHLAPGMYFLRVTSGGHYSVLKFLKE